MGVLTYLDFVYAGGSVMAAAGGLNSKAAPLMIKAPLTLNSAQPALAADQVFYAQAADGTQASYKLTFVGLSRIDGYPIFRVEGWTGSAYAQGGENGSEAIYQAIVAGEDFWLDDRSLVSAGTWDGGAELVKALEDHITGFSGSGFELSSRGDGSVASIDPYEREVGESTPDNLIGLSLFNKSVSAKTYQVAAAVTREQIQDLKQFGIDAVAQVEAVLVNELTQDINKLILDRIFKLGCTNAAQIEAVTGTVLSAAFNTAVVPGTTAITLGQDNTGAVVTVNAGNVTVGAGGETQGTLQRRILTKVLAATNLIGTRGRRGPADFAVTGGKMATAIQDVSGFVPYPLSNTINQAGGSLYPIGAVSGVTIYVDPNRDFNDTRIAVGRKGDGNSPGLVFMPYLMAESVETIAEGTMAPKIAIKSRFALVEAGFHPQTMYYTMDFKLTNVDII